MTRAIYTLTPECPDCGADLASDVPGDWDGPFECACGAALHIQVLLTYRVEKRDKREAALQARPTTR